MRIKIIIFVFIVAVSFSIVIFPHVKVLSQQVDAVLATYGSIGYTYGEKLNQIRISKNFWLSEFQSRKDGTVKIDPKLITAIQLLRDTARVRININSGYRTKEEQLKLNPLLPNSYHCKGMAADICSPDCDLLYLIKYVSAISAFRGIGLYDDHIHVDVRPEGQEYYWIYKSGRRIVGDSWEAVYRVWGEK